MPKTKTPEPATKVYRAASCARLSVDDESYGTSGSVMLRATRTIFSPSTRTSARFVPLPETTVPPLKSFLIRITSLISLSSIIQYTTKIPDFQTDFPQSGTFSYR